MDKNTYTNSIDRVEARMYNLPIISQYVEKSGGITQCSTESTSIASTAKGALLFPLSSERSSKKIMWNGFLSREALTRASLYSQKMNGKNRNPDSNRFRSPIARRGNSTGSIFQGPVRLIVTDRGGF